MSLSFSFLHLIIVLCNFRKKGKNRKESSEQLREQTNEDKLSKDDSDDEILASILMYCPLYHLFSFSETSSLTTMRRP